jgi:hypothetical protein
VRIGVRVLYSRAEREEEKRKQRIEDKEIEREW